MSKRNGPDEGRRAKGKSPTPVPEPELPEAARIAAQEREAAREAIKAYIPGIEAAEKKRAASKQEVEAKVAELAKLGSLDYDLARKEMAKELELPVSRLDKHVEHERGGGRTRRLDLPDTEPWHEPVDGAPLLDEIAAALLRHVGLPTRGEQAIALWIVHTHALAASNIAPRLALYSPVPGCGKSTALDMIRSMVPRPLVASNISASAVFRAIEQWHPVLIVDEADTFLKGNDELRGALNSGHGRALGYFVKSAPTAGNDYEARQFATFAPAAVAMIGNFPAALASRSIHIPMQRLAVGHTKQPYPSMESPYADLGRKAARWALDHLQELCRAKPALPDGLRNRDADNWRPLVAIADLAGGEWPQYAREAALTLTQAERGQVLANTLLADIREIISDLDRIASAELASRLAQMEGRPWPEFGKLARPISANTMARLLKPFGIVPRNLRMNDEGGTVLKGYLRADLQEAFDRYLDPT
jgi:putative DNA primase/helicase